jgi:hypothetical protein
MRGRFDPLDLRDLKHIRSHFREQPDFAGKESGQHPYDELAAAAPGAHLYRRAESGERQTKAAARPLGCIQRIATGRGQQLSINYSHPSGSGYRARAD